MASKYKISVIIGVYKNTAQLKNFVRRMSAQTDQDFEIICVVDTAYDRVLEAVDTFKVSFGDRFKLIFNSKRKGRENTITAGLQEAQGEYIQIISLNDVFDRSYITSLKRMIDKNPADIIEFTPNFKGVIKWIPRSRFVSSDKVIDIQRTPDVIAYSFPVFTNKLFKTSLVQQVEVPYHWPKIESRLSISWMYSIFDAAKTYKWVNQNILVMHLNEVKNTFNPIVFIKQWTSVIEHFSRRTSHFQQAIQYAAFYHLTLFLMKITIANGSEIVIKKYVKKINDELDHKFKNAFATNHYLLINNPDNKYLEKRRTFDEYLRDARLFK